MTRANNSKPGSTDSPVGPDGMAMYRFVAELFPICRSITGNGLRETLRRIGQEIPLTFHEVPSGTAVFDWTVPREWNIRDAYVKNARGERVIDFRRCNLHVLQYSVPVRARLSLDQLKPHLHSLPEHPDWIPYRTSYHAERWGFCLSHRQLENLEEGEYEVCIDSTLEPGHLTYGECVLAGQTEEEVLFSAHACHPSLANDNLSGLAVATWLAKHLARRPHRYTYRFLFAPGTIGAITWLARNESRVGRIRHGLVLTCLGDDGPCTYKRSRRGSAPMDRAVEHVLRHSGQPFSVLDFSPHGYDERQYGSPGFNLPVGCFMRTPNGRYPQYHTSADNLDLVKPHALADSLGKLLAVCRLLEANRVYLNQNPKCEPQLGRRGLYSTLGGGTESRRAELAMLWVLNLSDGGHSLLDIAERAQVPFAEIEQAARLLCAHGLLKEGSPRE